MAGLREELEPPKGQKAAKDPRLEELERLATELHNDGVDFRVEHGSVIQSPMDRDRDRETAVDLGKNHYRIGLVSDTHAGSKFEQLSALRSFYRYADDLLVDFFIHAGDWTQGSNRMHLGMEHEVHAHGAEAQVAYTVATYPQSQREGVRTFGIGGNHDASFKKDGGSNVVRQIAKERADIVYLGEDAAYLTLGPLRAYILHPDGGGAYAKSYKPQKIAESLPVEKDVRLLLLGHYHVWGQFKERRTHAFSLPCFQSQYSWLARKGLHPDIGGLILDLYLDDDGNLRRVTTELVTYDPVDEDWDREVSASVNRPWSSKGVKL